ncbi:hypothetical protein N7463_009268 [Penicillium fimorum]|uniref:Uncharacterized protein n=1 Tax=Penicillium fimorum TaxID=1882269 RepID=A0A9W9XQI1_9EURO|nr:hypothetical protein N7463_009268 [Penicillium fimorum]
MRKKIRVQRSHESNPLLDEQLPVVNFLFQKMNEEERPPLQPGEIGPNHACNVTLRARRKEKKRKREE